MAITNDPTNRLLHGLQHLSKDFREQVAQIIIDQQVEEFRKTIEPVVREEVEKYTYESWQKMNDYITMSEHVHLLIHYKGEITS